MKILILLTLLATLPGCMPRLAPLVKQLKSDPATVSVTVSSVYGTFKFVRTNPGTNTTTTVTPDGTVTVKHE